MEIPVTVCIPTLPSRSKLLQRALQSVEAQTYKPAKVIVQEDKEGKGSAHTRHKALMQVETEWVAFLDDDDEWMPHHLETLWTRKGDADLVYPYYKVKGGSDPWKNLGKPYRRGSIITTILVKTEIAQAVGFLRGEATEPAALQEAKERRRRGVGGRKSSGDDGHFATACHDLGAKIVHIPEITWIWHHHSGNTGGLPGIAK